MALFQSDHPSVGRRLFSRRFAAIIFHVIELGQIITEFGFQRFLEQLLNVKTWATLYVYGVLPDVTFQVLIQ